MALVLVWYVVIVRLLNILFNSASYVVNKEQACDTF